MLIRLATVVVTFGIAIVGVVFDVDETGTKLVLVGFASASFLLAAFVEVQASREAGFVQRALERLIQASTPSHLFAQAVSQVAIRAASDRGLPNSLLQERPLRDGYAIGLVFFDTHREALGYFEFDHVQLAEWSLLEEKRLAAVIVEVMFERPVLPVDAGERWNAMVEYIGTVSKTLYPESVHDGHFGIAANADTGMIGVPYPLGREPDPGARTQLMTLDGRPVPFLMFSPEELAELAARPAIAASATIAGWLAAAWGRPSVLG